MRDKLGTLPGIESGKESLVSILLTQSILLGIFIGAFDITAYSLLLSTFNEKTMALGYIISGIAGIIFIYFYSSFRTKVQFRNLAIVNLIVISFLTLSLWLALILSQAKWIIFIVFILLGPLNILALSGFRGTAEQLLTRKQGKRLFLYTDTGLIIGIIIISFTIPLLLSLKLSPRNFLLISASSVLAATIIQIIIGTRYNMTAASGIQNNEKPGTIKLLSMVLRKKGYPGIMIIFTVLSVLTALTIQYSFMAVTRVRYPAAEEMAGFLGLFTGCMMIFILLIKLVGFKYVLRNYGFKTCLIIYPVLIAVFAAVAVAIGLSMGYKPEESTGFIVFFIILAVSRFFSKSLKDSVESSSLKIIFQSFDDEIKGELNPGVVYTINEIAVLFSGLILTGLGLFTFIRLIHFSFLLFIIILLWIYVALKLYKEYRKSIMDSTEKSNRALPEDDILKKQDIFKNRFSAYLAFRTDYFSIISGDYSKVNNISNKWYFENLINYAYSKKDLNLIPVLKKTAANTNLNEGIRQHSSEVLAILQKHSTSTESGDAKISEAFKILSGTRIPQTTTILRLLRDNSVESKRLAIYMIGKFRLSDLLSEVCECFNIPGLARDAYEVLKTFGSRIEDELVRFYFVNSGNAKLSRTILQLFGKSCTKETTGFLFSRLWSNSRQQKEIAVNNLIDCNFRPSEEEKQRLDQLTSEVIGFITWNLSAKITLERENHFFLVEKIDQEIKRWKKFLFNILSITYNSGSIDRIRENVETETIENVSYALEMTNVIISDSVKPELISLFDVVPDEEKVKNLFQFYPGEIKSYKKLLEDIINCDYNLVSLWTKACTLRSISKIDYDDMAESVTALLFSPEKIIQEESVNLIARSNPDLYLKASDRIPGSIKIRLDKIMNGTIDKNELIFEKTQFLSECFGSVAEDDLLSLACEMKFINSLDSESFRSSEGIIIWPLENENFNNEVLVVYNGEIDKLIEKYQGHHNLSFYYLSLAAIEDYHFQFPDKSLEILKYIDSNEELFEPAP